ncbi:FCPA [Symbiodinium necroappetens]|uniref:FCPA protein n=1 Tax=Symbiodinium necroappetens TaxID=1628268 RepID=A0A812KYY0_9DINO|nr:FCPA [Symbiodinium necroappetens]
MFFQDGLTGSAWGDWALYTASPLRAEAEEEAPKPPPFDPAKQVGAMAPLGFFDPAGFSKVGDKDGFQSLRAAEIKHGRVAMMAALGAVLLTSLASAVCFLEPGRLKVLCSDVRLSWLTRKTAA